jgi:hypothetical protein
MVMRYLVLPLVITGMLWCTSAQAGNRPFTVELDTVSAEYGRPVELSLNSDTAKTLESIDLTPLKNDFVLQNIGDVKHATGKRQYRRELKLYPRRGGSLTIPSLRYRGSQSASIPLTVVEAMDRRDNSPIAVRTRIDSNSVWLKQGIYIDVEVETGSEIVDVELPALEAPGMKSNRIPYSTRPVSLNGKARTVHKLGWIVYPMESGLQKLQPPAILFKRDGVITHRFFSQEFEIEVKPLPPYVPVTLPVGKIQLKLDSGAPLVVTQNRLTYLKLRLSGSGLATQFSDYLANQLPSSEALSIYPADIKSSTSVLPRQVLTHFDYTIPYTPVSMGVTRLPAFRLQYFDPETGKITTEQFVPGSVFSIPLWLQIIASLVMLIILGIVIRLVVLWLHAYWQKVTTYRMALRQILAATSAPEIRDATRVIARAEGWPMNLTLENWLQRWSAGTSANEQLRDCIVRLQAMMYGKSDTVLDGIQQRLSDECRRRIPMLRLIG